MIFFRICTLGTTSLENIAPLLPVLWECETSPHLLSFYLFIYLIFQLFFRCFVENVFFCSFLNYQSDFHDVLIFLFLKSRVFCQYRFYILFRMNLFTVFTIWILHWFKFLSVYNCFTIKTWNKKKSESCIKPYKQRQNNWNWTTAERVKKKYDFFFGGIHSSYFRLFAFSLTLVWQLFIFLLPVPEDWCKIQRKPKKTIRNNLQTIHDDLR